jgi:hypothetical protein
VRPVTRRLVAGLLVLLVLLLALGALPSFLRSGDPYYLQAEHLNEAGADADGAIDAATLSERTHPYTFEALRSAANATDDQGRSSPYWRGPFGLKGAFTHSPFDELDSYRQQYPDATTESAAHVRYDDRTYRLTIIHP